MKLLSVLCSCAMMILIAAAQPAPATPPYEEPIRNHIENDVKPWINDPVIVSALKDQNELHAHLTPGRIQALDDVWQKEFSQSRRPLIDSVSGNALSKFLALKQRQSDGLITEIFVMDAKGLNIGQSEITSDYWQGDEAKWQKTYLVGSGVLFVDEARKDESTQMLQSQASLTISDPETGQPIGCITIGINLDAL